MRRLRNIALAFIITLQSVIFAIPSLAADTNLIANPSVESGTGVTPTSWQQDSWGTNTSAFSYSTDGHTGSRSLRIDMSARTSGDAKWMHDAVSVDSGSSYTYSSWYKSSVMTEIDLQYKKTDGSYSYGFVKTIPAAANWTQATGGFTVPTGVTSVTVLQIVASTGWLQTDDFSLSNDTVVPPTDPTPPTPVDNDNLIANNSFEIANAGVPTGWTKNAWGTNTSEFTYETTGRTGSRSATVRMTAATSGDAKWYAAPANVVAGKSYQYSDYYKSDITSRAVAAFVTATGAYSYIELASAPASPSTWAKYTASITIPADATKVSVYHLIDSAGYLTLDDVALGAAVPPSTTSLISNPSLETANGALPANWQKSSWGTNKPTFSYATNGHTGSKSAKITMKNYVDGDAKWYFDPIKLNSGEQYRFTAWYKGTVTPHAVAMFLMQDGSEQYFGMPSPKDVPSTTTWQKYTDTFSVPAGAIGTSVFLLINQNGWVQTDDYSIDSYHPNGFDRPLLTLTFDDGHEDNVTTALPLLNQYGYKTTQCYATSFIEGQPKAIINGVLAFKNSGHEICSHTVTHPFLTQLSLTNLDYELSHSKLYLQKLTGQPITDFASPYGDYNPQVNNEIKKFYTSHRSVDEGYNSKDNFDAYNIRVQNILDTTTKADVAGWVANAQADKTWLVLVYHRVASDAGPYDTTPALFAQQLKSISDSGIVVKTTKAALQEIAPQL